MYATSSFSLSYMPYSYFGSLEGVKRMIVPFMACGDLSAFDSDQTYQHNATDQFCQSLPPMQEPINPPYKTACLLKKTCCLASERNEDSSNMSTS